MTPPCLFEILNDLQQFLLDNAHLLDADPCEFADRLERFLAYAVCRAHREGARLMLKKLTPSEN